MPRKISRSFARRQRQRRIEALKVACVAVGGVVLGLPAACLFGLILGDSIHHTNATGAVVAALVSLFA